MKKNWMILMVLAATAIVAVSATLVGCGDVTGGRVTLRGGNQ